jgi:hypothetical protein
MNLEETKLQLDDERIDGERKEIAINDHFTTIMQKSLEKGMYIYVCIYIYIYVYIYVYIYTYSPAAA